MKKLGKILIILIITLMLGGCTEKFKPGKKHYKIMTSDFTAYDFTRGITNTASHIEVSMLIKPGMDLHNFTLTSQNIEDIKNSDMFIYNGSENEKWLKEVLKNIDLEKTEVIRLMDFVKTKDITFDDSDDIVEDEHIWVSPKKAITIVKYLKKEILKTTKNKEMEKINKNTDNYLLKLTKIDKELNEIVKNGKRHTIYVADSFSFTYLHEDYGIKIVALSNTCHKDEKISEDKITSFIQKVKEKEVPVIFYTENANLKLVERITDETKIKARELHSMHNIAINDFDKGITYIDIMKKNIKLIYEALN